MHVSPTTIPCDTVAAAHHFHLKPATLRQWLRRGHLTHHGHDHHGRALVDLLEIRERLTARNGPTPSPTLPS